MAEEEKQKSSVAARGEQIGSGSFSNVYAYDADRVVKVQPLLKEETLKELSIAATCAGHPHLTSYERVFVTRELDREQRPTLYANCVMRRACCDLRKYLERGMPSAPDRATARLICYQLAQAVARLRDMCVLHRDIKPENVLVFGADDSGSGGSDDGGGRGGAGGAGGAEGVGLRVALADYSLSCFEPVADFGFQAYTEWYRAPEVWTSEGYSYAAEVWALACVFYEVHVGYALFALSKEEMLQMQDRSRRELFMSARLTTRLWELRTVDAELVEVLSRALAFDPAKRATLGDVLRSRLFSSLESASLSSAMREASADGRVQSLRRTQITPLCRAAWRKSAEVVTTIAKSVHTNSFQRACALLDVTAASTQESQVSFISLARACCVLAATVDDTKHAVETLDIRSVEAVLRATRWQLRVTTRGDWLREWHAGEKARRLARDAWALPLVYTEETVAAATVHVTGDVAAMSRVRPDVKVPQDLVGQLSPLAQRRAQQATPQEQQAVGDTSA
jgi:serine/threonine protein kinase